MASSTEANHRLQGRAAVIATLVAVFLAALATSPTVASAADTFYVDVENGDNMTGDGTIGRPFKHIWRGLAEADYGDTVMVAAGTYSPSTGEAIPVEVPVGVRLRGDDTPRPLPVEGLTGTVLEGDGTSRLMQITDGDGNTIVEGFLFRDNIHVGAGAAILIARGALPGGGPVVRDCIFQDLDAAAGGGAIRVTKETAAQCSPVIEGCAFISLDGGTDSNGGAIWSTDAACTIRDCEFMVCGVDGPSGFGGALAFEGAGESAIEGCEFGTCSSEVGGAIYAHNHSVRITESRFTANRARYGGAVYFRDNIAPDDDTDLNVENCLFSNNDTTGGEGTAIRTNGGRVFIYNCTLYLNDDPVDAGAIAALGGSQVIHNSILWGNGDDLLIMGGTLDLSHCCIEDTDDTGSGVIHSDPRLHRTGMHWRLLPDSPCIDSGDNSSATDIDLEGRARPADGDGNGTAVVDMGAYERSPLVDRAAGADRYATAIAASAKNFDRAGAGIVVLATGTDYPDALCAAPLAGLMHGPILLTMPTRLPSGLVAELRRLDTERVYVVGGTRAVSDDVVDQLHDLGYEVRRLDGADRYGTSRAIAMELYRLRGSRLSTLAIVARGDAFPDALSGSPFAWRAWSPILLTKPDALPSSTRDTIDELEFTRALVVGGTSAVSESVFNQIDDLVGGNALRFAGSDRYETAVAFARGVHDTPGLGEAYYDDFIGLATGSDFPDALCGGAASGANHGPILLTRADRLPSSTRNFIDEYGDTLVHVETFGGPSVVRDAVLSEVRGLIP